MDWLRLTPDVIPPLVAGVLNGLGVLYLLSLRDKTRTTWLLLGYMAISCASAMFTLLYESALAAWQPHLLLARNLTYLVREIVLLQFAFDFLATEKGPRGLKTVVAVATLGVLCGASMVVLVTGTGLPNVLWFVPVVGGLVGATLAAPAVFFGRAWRMARAADAAAKHRAPVRPNAGMGIWIGQAIPTPIILKIMRTAL